MGFADKILKKLFHPKKDSSSKEELVHTEPLIRNLGFVQAYEKWKETPELSLFMNELYDSWKKAKAGIDGDLIVGLHQSPYANGIVLYYTQNLSPQKFTYLFDLIAEKTLELSYKTYDSNVKYFSTGDDVKTIEKHYLKPAASAEPPVDQRYGNVLIEKVEKNEVPKYIKLLVSIYSDRNYTKALPFEEYMRYITSH